MINSEEMTSQPDNQTGNLCSDYLSSIAFHSLKKNHNFLISYPILLKPWDATICGNGETSQCIFFRQALYITVRSNGKNYLSLLLSHTHAKDKVQWNLYKDRSRDIIKVVFIDRFLLWRFH